MREILDELERWRESGTACVVARVVDIEGSGPRLPGAAMAVTVDGDVSFADLCREIHRQQEAGGFTALDVMAAVNRYGKQSLGQLAVADEAFSRANMLADLRALAASKGVA